MIRVFTNSEIQTFKECRRKWWLAWYRRLRLRQDRVNAAKVGSIVHDALEHLYAQGGDPVAFITRVVEPRERLKCDPEQSKDLDKALELAKIMVQGFLDWRAEVGLDVGMKVIGVEEKLSVEFPAPPRRPDSWERVELKGKIDVLMQNTVSSHTINRDWKTVQSIEAGGLWRVEQFKTYALIKRLLGSRVNGAQRVMLRKVKRTATAKPPFYGVDEVTFNDADLRRFHGRLFGEVSDVAALELALDTRGDPGMIAYPSPSRDCSWRCEFYAVCPMFDDGSNVEGMLERFYVEGNPLERYEETKDEED